MSRHTDIGQDDSGNQTLGMRLGNDAGKFVRHKIAKRVALIAIPILIPVVITAIIMGTMSGGLGSGSEANNIVSNEISKYPSTNVIQSTCKSTGSNTSDSGDSSTSDAIDVMIKNAKKCLGAGYSTHGYTWIGSPQGSSITCSGLVDLALCTCANGGFSAKGCTEDHSVHTPEDYMSLTHADKKNVSDFQVGDLLYYEYDGRIPGHVAIYVGDGNVIHANGSTYGVIIQPWDFDSGFIGAGTLPSDMLSTVYDWDTGQQPSGTSSSSTSSDSDMSDISVSDSQWQTGKASGYGGRGDASIADNQQTATGEAVNETSMGVAIPMAWNAGTKYYGKAVVIKYNGKTVTAKINDCGNMNNGERALDLQPGVFKALLGKDCDANEWGVRDVQYYITNQDYTGSDVSTSSDDNASGSLGINCNDDANTSSTSNSSTSSDSSNDGSIPDDGNLTENQQKIVDAAHKVTFHQANWCMKYVSLVFEEAGFGYPSGNACDAYAQWCTSSNKSDLKVGMIVATAPSGATGSAFGHVGIYIGNGKVIHNIGKIEEMNLDDWINTYGPSGKYHGGVVKWGWCMGKDLSQ